MAILTQLNDTLKNLYPISKDLENKITNCDWNDEDKKLAITIIKQLNDYHGLVSTVKTFNYEYIEFHDLRITLNLDNFFDDFSAIEYIKKLLNSINQISPIIIFSLKKSTSKPEISKILFDISWIF